MIRLFDRDETNFNHNETPLPDVLNATVEVEANGMYELVLDYPRNAFAKTLTAGKILKAPTPDGEQLFRIYKPIKNLKTYKIYARHIFYDLAKNFIENVRPTTTSGSSAIASILGGASVEHGFTGYSDISDARTANYVRMSPIEALLGSSNSFLSVWGGELTRDNYNFRIDAQGGRDRGYEVRLGKNLIGIEADIDETNIFTCIYPTVVIEGNTVTTLPEKYVYSPLVGSYESTYVIEERIELLDEEKELPLEAIYTLMRERSALLFENGADKPEVNYKVDFVELSKTEQYKHLQILEQLNLYDTVDVIVDELDIRVKAKAVKYAYDALRERYVSMELGNFKQNLASQAKNTLGMVEKQIENSTNVIREAFERSNDLITGNRGGHIVIRRNAEGLPYEQLVMDTDDIQTATNVIRLNQQGIGFSDTGYNGPFGVAVTIDGTLNAEVINAINLKVENLVGNKSAFVQTAWNAIDNDVVINGDGMTSMNADNDYSRITAGEIRSYNAAGSASAILGEGRAQFYSASDSLFIAGRDIHSSKSGGLIGASFMQPFSIGRYDRYVSSGDGTPQYNSYIELGYSGTDDYRDANGVVRLLRDTYMGGSLQMEGNAIRNPNEITLANGGFLTSLSENSQMRLRASGQLQIGTSGSWGLLMDNSYMYSYRNLSMEGNSITNQSDERLKNVIGETDYDALSFFHDIIPKEWTWKDAERFGNQTEIGFVAQDIERLDPTLVTQTPDDSTDDGCAWAINETDMNRRAWVALHQLSRKVAELDERTSIS